MTLLDRQLLSIQQTEQINEVVLVLGYLAEQVESKVTTFKKNGMNIRTVYNPFFETSNNLMSLWLASLSIDSDFVVINGDDVFKLTVLQDVVGVSETKDVAMVMNRKDSYDEDDMKLIIGLCT